VEEFFMKPIQESGILPQQIFAGIFGDILGIRWVSIYSVFLASEQIRNSFTLQGQGNFQPAVCVRVEQLSTEISVQDILLFCLLLSFSFA
jgi:hypothetical protein